MNNKKIRIESNLYEDVIRVYTPYKYEFYRFAKENIGFWNNRKKCWEWFYTPEIENFLKESIIKIYGPCGVIENNKITNNIPNRSALLEIE